MSNSNNVIIQELDRLLEEAKKRTLNGSLTNRNGHSSEEYAPHSANDESETRKINYTIFPNYIFDSQKYFTAAEFSIISYIVRKTSGYQRKIAEISISEFVSNCNVSRRAVIYIVKRLEKVGIVNVIRVKKEKTNSINSYSIASIDLFGAALNKLTESRQKKDKIIKDVTF